MKKLFTFLFMAGWLISNSAFATIFLVENGTGTSTWRAAGAGEVNVVLSGTSLNAWYTTATIAVGDQVWIKNGTYVLDGTITPKGGESIYGGFAGTETAISQRAKGTNAWDFTNETVLDGNKDVGNTTGTNVIAPATSNLNPTMIGGLTITKGINLAIWNMGAGATLENNTIMQNCKVFNCYLGSAGIGTSSAGVHVRGFAKLLNSYIYNNVSAGSTGGVAVLPDGIIDGCKIDGNTAAINGGGVYINSGTGGGAKVLNSTITNNSVTASGTSSNGGGINVWQNSTLTSNIEITNCTISNNSSSNVAGGFGMNQTATPYNLVVLTNVTMNANTAASSGGAISISKGDTRLNNCTLTNNVSGNVGGAINVSANTTEFTINNTLIKGNSVPDANNASAINAAFPIVCNNVVITGNKGKNHMSIVFTTTPGASFNNCTFASNTLNDGITFVTMTQKTSLSNIYTNCLFYNCNNNPLFYQTTSGGVAPSIKNCGFDATGAGKVNTYTDLGNNIVTLDATSFVNAANGDFRLSSTSVAKDVGTTIAATSSDIAGVPRPVGSAFDMGAYEYFANNTFISSGNWSDKNNWSPAVLPMSDAAVIVNSATTLSLNQHATVASLTVAPGAKVNINAGNTLTTNNLTINSDATGTGTYVDKGTTTVTNPATVNQFLTYRSWYMSSPVLSATPANMGVIRAYDEASNTWLASTPTMASKIGYLVTPTDNTISNIQFSGTLNKGDLNIPLTSRTGTADKAGFNLIGNPYPCYLDWNLVATVPANLAAMRSSTMWYRTKSSGGTYSFWTVNGAGVGSPATANKDIPPMQAFWVRAVEGGGNLSLTTDMLSHGPETNKMLKAPSVDKTDMTLIRLQVSNGTNTDEAVIYFNENSSNGLDAYDAPKMSNTNVEIPEIYSSVGNEQLVINGMNSIQLDTPIGIGFVPGNATSFSIKANEVSNLPSNVRMILKDNVTHIETDLSDGAAAYTFAPATTSADRFSVIFRSQGATTELSKLNENNYIVFSNNKKITLVSSNATLENAFVKVYNSVGQQVWVEKMTSNSMEMNREFSAGVYVVNINDVNKKVLVK